MRKPTWFLNRSDTNRSVQLQKTASSLKFCIYKEEGLYYLCSENKDEDQLRSYCELILAFVFAYAKCWFSPDAAQMCFLLFFFLFPFFFVFLSRSSKKAAIAQKVST